MLQLPFSVEQIETYVLVFIRASAIIFSVPIFGSRDFPVIAKMGLACTIAWIVYPTVPIPPELYGGRLLTLVPAMVAEILLGIIIGFTARLFFEGVQLGGQLAGFQMGFGIVNVLDPITGENFSVISQLQNLFAIMLFLGANLHHWFFKAFVLSFEKIPLLHCTVSAALFQELCTISASIFVVAVKLAAPIMAVLLFSDFALGILNRAAPQMHIFILSFPLKIAIGLFMLGLTLPMFCIMLRKIFGNYEGYIAVILKWGAVS